jgi:hypothetical protein
MLSLLLGVRFNGPVRLKKEELLDALRPFLDSFHEKELL